MLRDEFNLLVRDFLPQAEIAVRKAALPGSLTEKVLKGYFGDRSRTALFVRKARSLAVDRTL
jgi:hypothetical protein